MLKKSMATSLTAAQLISITTNNPTPPWKMSSIPNRWREAGKPLSLKSVASKFEATTTVFIFGVRNAGIVSASNSFSDFVQNLKQPNKQWVLSREDLVSLIQTLSKYNIAVHGLSADWQVIAVSGPASAFAALPCNILSSAGAGPSTIGVAEGVSDLLPKSGWSSIVVGVGGWAAYAIGSTPIGRAILAGLATSVPISKGLYDLTMPRGGDVPNPNFGQYTGGDSTNGVWIAIEVGSGSISAAEAEDEYRNVTTLPPLTADQIPANPPSPPQSDTSPTTSDFATGVETSTKPDKESSEKGKDGKDNKEGKEATDLDPIKAKDGSKEGKDGKDDKDVKEGTDKLKEGKDGKDEKDGKESTDKGKESSDKGKETSDKFTKEVSDGGLIKEPSPDPGLKVTSPVVPVEHEPEAPVEIKKPVSLLSRTPLV
jgi:hypothetical protein